MFELLMKSIIIILIVILSVVFLFLFPDKLFFFGRATHRYVASRYIKIILCLYIMENFIFAKFSQLF